MPTPSTFNLSIGGVAYISTCVKVERQDHLATCGVDDKGVTTATESFVVLWNNPSRTIACRGASDGTNTVPGRGSQHPDATTLYGKRLAVKPVVDKTRNAFLAVMEYSDEPESAADSPLALPPDIRWSFQEEGSKPYVLDFNPDGPKLVANAAGDLFDFLQRPNCQALVTWAKNLTPGATASLLPYVLKYTSYRVPGTINDTVPVINSDAFTMDGIPFSPFQARFRGGDVSGVQRSGGYTYRTLTCSLAIRSSWVEHVQNRGLRYKRNGVVYPIPGSADPGRHDDNDPGWPLTSSGDLKPKKSDDADDAPVWPFPQQPFGIFGFA